MPIALLRLEGVLQAWSTLPRTRVRQTESLPTKSGVVGLIAATLGYPRSRDLSPLSEALTFGIRVDRPGVVIEDFQTVGANYGRPIHTTYAGKPKMTARPAADWADIDRRPIPHAEVTYRYYLSDASFVVAVCGQAALIAEISAALQAPVFAPYLGRRCCVPTERVFLGRTDSDDLVATLRAAPQPRLVGAVPAGQIVIECGPSHPDAFRRATVASAFRPDGERVFVPMYMRLVRQES